MFANQPNSSGSFGEHHTIETPEQTHLEFSVAGIGSRFLAVTVDFMIQGAAALALIIVALVLNATGVLRALPVSQQWVTALSIIFFFVMQYGYFAVFEILWHGQTPGKRMVHIRVIKDSGRPLSVSETIGRNLMRIADQLPAFYAVGIVSMLITAQNKRLGDLVAGSIVIREGSLSQMRPVWHSAEPAPSAAGTGLRLPADDLALIEAFLARRHELPGNVRARMAGEILERLRTKVSTQIGVDSSAESVLETIAYESRSNSGYL